MSYDPASAILASYFLGPDAAPDRVEALAQEIQDTVEDFLFDEQWEEPKQSRDNGGKNTGGSPDA